MTDSSDGMAVVEAFIADAHSILEEHGGTEPDAMGGHGEQVRGALQQPCVYP